MGKWPERRFGREENALKKQYVNPLVSLELVKDKTSRENFDPALKVGPLVMNEAAEHGLIIRALINDTIAFCPPLIITEVQIDEMFDRFAKTLEAAAGSIDSLAA
jgi:4-aminobutyrate--pyruvate transaminase